MISANAPGKNAMTYVLATVRRGTAAIVADSRATSTIAEQSHDDMAKVGILFPGCLFGVAGSSAALTPFISDFQQSAVADEHDVAGNWSYFQKYVASFRSTEAFQVVLAERSSGTPRLHVYDSSIRKLRETTGIVTLGSGKPLFDESIKRWMELELNEIDDRLNSMYGNNRLFPSFISLQLIAHVQGEHSAFFRRQDVGIGGVFHYATVDAASEALQPPCIYLVVSHDPPGSKHLAIKPFRLCGTSFGLSIQGPPPFDVLPSLHLNMAKRHRLPTWANSVEVDKFIQEVLKELNALPFYNFLGVCFAQDAYGDRILVDTTFTNEYVWTGGDSFTHEFRLQIEAAIDNPSPRPR